LKENDPARSVGIPKRSVKGLVIVQDWAKADQNFTNMTEGAEKGKIFQYLPKANFLDVEKDSKGDICKVSIASKWGGVSTLHFNTVKSFLTNPMSHESLNWDFIHVDEPCPREMWIAHSRGLMDTGGSAWFLCTPLDQPWINKMFIPSRTDKVDEVTGSVFFDKKWVMIGNTRDNPYLKEEDVADFEDSLTTEERLCRLQGHPLSAAGMVYKEFRPDEHTWTDENPPKGWASMTEPPKDYCIRYAIDPHPRTPHAVLFAATAPTGEVFFFSEIFSQCLIVDLCDAIKERLGGRHVQIALCDPIAYIENPVDGTAWADVMEDEGLVLEKAPKDLQRGIVQVQQALKQTMPNGTRWLRFMPHLVETHYEFDNYCWDSKKPNSPVDKDDHMMENLYRMVITGLDYIAPPDPKADKHFPQFYPNRLDFSTGVEYFESVADSAVDNTSLGL